MKLAISNIAWEKHNDPAILSELAAMNVQGIEVAPTKTWPNWEGIDIKSARNYKVFLSDYGFQVPAFQAILFGKPELQLFKQDTHHSFLEHLRLIAEIAAEMGAKVLVFGAPKNRLRGQHGIGDAMEIAKEFFYQAGEVCSQFDCCLGLEANPADYGCDFITNVADAIEMVHSVSHPGLKLHLDSAGIHMCGGDIGAIIRLAGEFSHYHISEPMLAPIVDGQVDHLNAKNALVDINYNGWVSIEMRQVTEPDILFESVKTANKCYLES